MVVVITRTAVSDVALLTLVSGMMQSSPMAQYAPQYSHHPAAHAQSPYATQQPSQGQSSFSMGSLKRPKDYLQQSAQSRGLNSQNASVSAF